MTLWQVLVLGILQGATEFLPVSSSGHLVLIPHLLGWPDTGLALNVMLHLGTMVAIVAYFWRDLWALARAAWESLRQRSLAQPEARLAWQLALATIPGAVLGLLLEDFFEALFSNPRAAAAFLLGTAALIVAAETLGRRTRALDTLSWAHALGIGLAQSLAIVPGLSRSGATISAALLLGYRREDATRFSFLLAVPIVLGGGGYQLLKFFGAEVTLPFGLLLAGMFAAAVTGYLAIAGLLALVRRHALWPFAVYCALFGILVLTGILG